MMTRPIGKLIALALLFAPLTALTAQRVLVSAQTTMHPSQPDQSTHEVATQLAGLMAHAASPTASSSSTRATTDAQRMFEMTQHLVQKYAPADSIAEILARELERAFDDGDLRALLAFYSSPAGVRFVAVQPRMTEAVRVEVARLLAPHKLEMEDSLTAFLQNAPK